MKHKICVYAICKNEAKFIDRWINSLKEADYIKVLDTGSTDDTIEKLKKYAPLVEVHQKIIDPWRFDVARNESMKYIPADADICVVSDCDQIFRTGWADDLKKQFDLGFEEVYGDIIDYDKDNNEIKRFLSKNVHPNSPDWYWERPIHEGIEYHGDREIKSIISDNFVIEHHPDPNKSRESYLGLLEIEYKENSKDPMCAIYYGCELSFHGKSEEALEVFLKAMKECDFSQHPEVGYQICINISNSYRVIDKYNEALEWAMRARDYNIYTRRLYMTAAYVYYDMENGKMLLFRLI